MIGFSFVFPFIPLYVRELGATETAAAARWAGAISAASAVTMALAQPFWGSLADRHGRRVMVLRSLAAAGVTLALMGFARQPWQLLVLRLLQGALTGTVAASNALVATSVPRERLGASLGLMQVALYGGTSVGPLMGGVIADRFGYRAPCFAAGGLLLLSVLFVVGFVHESFTPPPADARRPGVLAETRELMAVPGLAFLMAVTFLIQYGNSAVSPILALFVHELSSGTNAASMSGAILAGTGVASAVAAVVIGRLADRLGHRRILLVCLFGAALACVPQAWVRSVGELFAWRLVLGLFLGGLMPSAHALFASLVPAARRGSAFGLGGTAASLANAAGPLSGAFLAGAVGLNAVFIATAVLYSLGLGFLIARFRGLPAHVRELRPSLAPPEALA